jgi:two-component system response regulator HydG
LTDIISKGRVLLVDDDPLICQFLERLLGKQGFSVFSENSAEDALERLPVEDFDVVLSDLNMAGLDGLAFTERVLQHRADVPVILMTGSATTEIAIAALRVGAWDFLIKPIDPEFLAASMERALKHRALKSEVVRLRALLPAARPSKIIGNSAPMKQVYDLVTRVAPGEAAVLITGESGTGKELVANAIHLGSARKDGPFIAINCAAVPANLLESELFGHVRGAFTDAKNDRRGLFAQAEGGTLFLDEIGELPLELQPKLLRALQERKVRPLGGTTEVPFNARLITATNRDLETEVHHKRFREDLFYRVNVVKIDVPPLRDRHGDVLILAQHFVQAAADQTSKQVKGISAAVAERLLAYEWRGNVRELENCMESAVALARFDELSVDDLPAKVRQYHSQRVVVAAERAEELVTLDELGQRYLQRVLVMLDGNKTRAAKSLGIDRRTLYRMLAELEPTPPEPRA